MPESKYTYDVLKPLVSNCTSLREVLRNLGLQITGSNRRRIRRQIARFGISTDHFKRKAWNKGLTEATSVTVAKCGKKIDPTQYLTRNSYCPSARLKRYLLRTGREYKCEHCKSDAVWNGKPLTLHIDHIDGDRDNNEAFNLRFLCPNCHQQTETWGKGKMVYG